MAAATENTQAVSQEKPAPKVLEGFRVCLAPYCIRREGLTKGRSTWADSPSASVHLFRALWGPSADFAQYTEEDVSSFVAKVGGDM